MATPVAVPAWGGIFDGRKPLKMLETGNHIFRSRILHTRWKDVYNNIAHTGNSDHPRGRFGVE
jgi:hypothetical protein